MQQVQSFDETVHARVSTCRHSWRILNPGAGPWAQRTTRDCRPCTAPLILSEALVYSPITLDFIIDPGQLRPEFFGGHPPRIQFGPPPDRLPFARGEVRIQPERPEKGFSSPQPACPYSGGRQGRRSHQAIVEKERPFHHNGHIRLSAGCLSFRTAGAFPDPSPPDSGASTTNRFHGRPQGGNADVQFDTSRSLVPATGLPIRRACGQRRGG